MLIAYLTSFFFGRRAGRPCAGQPAARAPQCRKDRRPRGRGRAHARCARRGPPAGTAGRPCEPYARAGSWEGGIAARLVRTLTRAAYPPERAR